MVVKETVVFTGTCMVKREHYLSEQPKEQVSPMPFLKFKKARTLATNSDNFN